MKLLSFATLVLTLMITPALADDAYRLKSKIEISGPTISLADLIDGPDLPDDPLFGAPNPGKTGTIQVARIIAAFKKATGRQLTVTSNTPVTVTRRARLIAESDIALKMQRLLARDFKIVDPEIRLQLDETMSLAVDETATGEPVISNLRLDPQSLRFEAQLNMQSAEQSATPPITLKGYVMADRLVPVLTRAIDKGQPVTGNDIRMERRLRASLEGKTVLALADIQNRIALMPLAAGDVVTDERIGKPMLIEKGGAVNVTYIANGLLLTLRGRATEAGALGDVIGFTNPQSKKLLYGTVSGEGALRVTSAMTKEARLQSDADTQPQ